MQPTAKPAVSLDGTVVFGVYQAGAGGSAAVTAFDALTGAKLWQVTPSGQPSVLGVAPNETVIIARSGNVSNDQQVAGLDPATGSVCWTSPLIGLPLVICRNGTIVASNFNVSVSLTALSSVTGATIWQQGGIDVFLDAGAADGTVYCQTPSNQIDPVSIVALDGSSGTQLWQQVTDTGAGVAVRKDGSIVSASGPSTTHTPNNSFVVLR